MATQGNQDNSSGRPGPDLSGQDRPWPDKTGQDRRVTVDEAVSIFEQKNLPRSKRAIRRYCQRGYLDCEPIDNLNGREQHSTVPRQRLLDRLR